MTRTGHEAERERPRRPAAGQARSSNDGPQSLRMLALQRSVGNRAVTTLVQRECTGGGCCAGCAAKADEVPADMPDAARDVM